MIMRREQRDEGPGTILHGSGEIIGGSSIQNELGRPMFAVHARSSRL